MKHMIWAIAVALCMAVGSAWAGDSVNINTASATELQKVHGIGEKTAERILAYRDEHGAFESVEDLKHVKGIGEKNLEKIKGELTVGEVKE